MCRSQISRSTKDQFAGENEVCEISKMYKKGYKITSKQKADFAAAAKLAFSLRCLASNVSQISGKLQEEFHNTVQNGYEIISQQKGDFAAVQNSSFNLE